jgi:group I intron endonuclease
MTIYIIRNKNTNKVYIGQTIRKSVKQYWRDAHYCKLIKNKHPNKHLQCAWNIDGELNFSFKTLDFANNIEELNALEIFYISLYRSSEKLFGYNKTSGGKNFKHSEESKQLMVTYNKNRTIHTEWKLIWSKIGKNNKGKKRTIDVCEKIGKIWRGKNREPFSSDHITQLVEKRNNRVCTDVTKLRMAETRKRKNNTGITQIDIAKQLNMSRSVISSVIYQKNNYSPSSEYKVIAELVRTKYPMSDMLLNKAKQLGI